MLSIQNAHEYKQAAILLILKRGVCEVNVCGSWRKPRRILQNALVQCSTVDLQRKPHLFQTNRVNVYPHFTPISRPENHTLKNGTYLYGNFREVPPPLPPSPSTTLTRNLLTPPLGHKLCCVNQVHDLPTTNASNSKKFPCFESCFKTLRFDSLGKSGDRHFAVLPILPCGKREEFNL